jgi:heptosyltransferase-2
MKIIILALSGIGDALMFSPALQLLREKYPDAHVDLLSMFKGVQELYSRNQDVNNVYHWDFQQSNPFSSLACVIKLRRLNYDISINVYPSNRWPYNIISFLIGANKRLGHDYNHVNFRSLNFLNNIRVKEDDLLHNVEENVRLVKLLDINTSGELPSLKVILNDADKISADEWLRNNKVSSSSLVIGFHAGSSLLKNHVRRRWAPEKFAALGKQLIEKHKATILLFGGPEEHTLNQSINQMMDGKGIIVSTQGLMSSVAVMKKCSAFVVNDSGLMHLAAGLHLPVVTIFAYTNPRYVYPWSTKYIMVRRELECSPCFYYSPRSATCKWKEDQFRCVTHIEVNEVYDSVLNILRSTNIPIA